MCVVSMVGDEFSKRWSPVDWEKFYQFTTPMITQTPAPFNAEFEALKKEFEDLKKEVLLMKDLLKAAKIYDEKNNEPSCEMEDKIKLLKDVAKLFGVDLSEIFKDKK